MLKAWPLISQCSEVEPLDQKGSDLLVNWFKWINCINPLMDSQLHGLLGGTRDFRRWGLDGGDESLGVCS
jgi:hypothetical protein